MVRLTVISIASPACITLVPMRPAKSFWKKVQDWRITCQWLCQRTRSTRFGVIAWFLTSASATKKSGRSSTTANISASVGAVRGEELAGRRGREHADGPADEDRQHGVGDRAERDQCEARDQRAAELAQEVGEERAGAGRRLPVGRERGRGIEACRNGR